VLVEKGLDRITLYSSIEPFLAAQDVDQVTKDCASLTTSARLRSLYDNGIGRCEVFDPSKVYGDAATAVVRTILLACPF
jgi:hypothetical protein